MKKMFSDFVAFVNFVVKSLLSKFAQGAQICRYSSTKSTKDKLFLKIRFLLFWSDLRVRRDLRGKILLLE